MAHASTTSPTARQGHYYVPQPMPWPIMGSFSIFCMALGGVFVMNGVQAGWISMALGLMVLIYMVFRGFGDRVRESEWG